jgi:hypothetical protein
MEHLRAQTGDRTTALAALRAVARRFEQSGNIIEQIQTILSMLDSIVALGALAPAATISGAVARTAWRDTAACQRIDQHLADTMPPNEYHAARRAGPAPVPQQAGHLGLSPRRRPRRTRLTLVRCRRPDAGRPHPATTFVESIAPLA